MHRPGNYNAYMYTRVR